MLVYFGVARVPTKDQHIEQAQHNEAFCNFLSGLATPRPYLDCEIAGLFYAAVHYIDAILATKLTTGIHPRDHLQRNHLVSTVTDFAAINTQYLQLENRRRNAQYDLIKSSEANVQTFRENLFNPIRTDVRHKLGLH